MARETNVEGTKALARAMENAPRLERFLFVGTAYRLGVAEASLVEEGLPSSAEHLVEYTRTKAEAEAHLESHRGLPLVIARPSIVVGHTKLGVRPSASLFWYYRALAQGALSPFAADRRRDIVPVDWVADAIVHLLLKPSLEHIRYHLSAGEVSADTWASIRDTFPPSVGSFDAWTLGAIEACAKFAQLSYDLFSNQRLLAEGMPPPPRFTSYLRRCIETSDRTVDEQARDDV